MKTGSLSLGVTRVGSGSRVPAAPSNALAPVITGHDSDGSTLASTPGGWNGYPSPTFSYQWKSAGANVGSNQATYVTQPGDIGKAITCTVTATNTEGNAASPPSNSITVTTSAAPPNTAAPVVCGTQPAGSTIPTTTGTWTGNRAVDTYSYQWKADAGNVGADQATYVTQAGDVGKSITCTVTATNRKGSTAQASNGITVTAALAAPANTVAPVVSGAQIVGSTMTSTTGTWTGNPSPTYSYQWKSAGTNVGTDQNTYVSQSSDASKSITCVVTATNSQGSTSQSSNGISMSALSAPANTVAPAISGDTGDGSTLTSTTGTWTGNPTPTYAYQWKADSTNVGSNQNTYVTQAGDVGKSVTCTVTATNSQGNSSQASNGITVTLSDPDAVITALFANSEQGLWYDPSDLTTMFQDRAGTTPVTTDGQTVGKILDKSGNDNHAVAPSDAARPLYKTSGGLHWLQFDGVDDSLSTASFDLSLSTKASLFFGFNKTSDQNPAWLFENIVGNTNGISVAQRGTSIEIGFKTGNEMNETVAPYSAQQKLVVTALFDPDNVTYQGKIGIRVDGTPIEGSVWNNANAGNFGNFPLNIGKRSDGYYLDFHLNSLIILGRLATTQESTDTETWVNGKTGAY